MSIQNFLKARRGDPDWAYTPDKFFDKKFHLLDASGMTVTPWQSESVVFRQNPTENNLLAKRVNVEVQENAELNLIIINESSQKTQQVFMYDIILRDSATLSLGIFLQGGSLNKHIFNVSLENYSNFNNFGHIQNYHFGDSEVITRTVHHGIHSNSEQLFTCEAGRASQTVVQSVIQIPDCSNFAEAGIDISGLVTGEGGKCHSAPTFFNHADNAKTNMSGVTEFLDAEKIYYLESRGLDKSKAETIIIDTHRKKTLELIDNEEIKAELRELFSDYQTGF